MPTDAPKPVRQDAPARYDPPHSEADGPFLRRILFGLVTAAVVTGALSVAMTAQHLQADPVEIAGSWRPV